MIMTPSYITAHPKFASYVRNDVSSLVRVNAIISAIKKFSGATTKARIGQGLKWGSGPTINIVPGLVCDGKRSYGCYAWGGNIIQISKSLVQAYEAGRDLRPTLSGAMVHVAGVTLLHELTHWADAMDGVDDPVPGDPLNEEGNAFELAVYGKIIVL